MKGLFLVMILLGHASFAQFEHFNTSTDPNDCVLPVNWVKTKRVGVDYYNRYLKKGTQLRLSVAAEPNFYVQEGLILNDIVTIGQWMEFKRSNYRLQIVCNKDAPGFIMRTESLPGIEPAWASFYVYMVIEEGNFQLKEAEFKLKDGALIPGSVTKFAKISSKSNDFLNQIFLKTDLSKKWLSEIDKSKKQKKLSWKKRGDQLYSLSKVLFNGFYYSSRDFFFEKLKTYTNSFFEVGRYAKHLITKSLDEETAKQLRDYNETYYSAKDALRLSSPILEDIDFGKFKAIFHWDLYPNIQIGKNVIRYLKALSKKHDKVAIVLEQFNEANVEDWNKFKNNEINIDQLKTIVWENTIWAEYPWDKFKEIFQFCKKKNIEIIPGYPYGLHWAETQKRDDFAIEQLALHSKENPGFKYLLFFGETHLLGKNHMIDRVNHMFGKNKVATITGGNIKTSWDIRQFVDLKNIKKNVDSKVIRLGPHSDTYTALVNSPFDFPFLYLNLVSNYYSDKDAFKSLSDGLRNELKVFFRSLLKAEEVYGAKKNDEIERRKLVRLSMKNVIRSDKRIKRKINELKEFIKDSHREDGLDGSTVKEILEKF